MCDFFFKTMNADPFFILHSGIVIYAMRKVSVSTHHSKWGATRYVRPPYQSAPSDCDNAGDSHQHGSSCMSTYLNGTLPKENHLQSFEDDLDVESQRPILDIIEIHFQHFLKVHDLISPTGLPNPGEAWSEA